MTFTEDTHLSISKGDEQREEKTKEEMQKNVLSIRGEDRRYWKYPIVWIFVIWKLISLRTEPHCPKVIMSAIPDGRSFSFRISMVWVHNGCAWERTSQEEGDLQVRKIFSKDLKNLTKHHFLRYEAPWTVFSMNWSVRPDKRFRLALGSFVEEYNNKVQVVR